MKEVLGNADIRRPATPKPTIERLDAAARRRSCGSVVIFSHRTAQLCMCPQKLGRTNQVLEGGEVRVIYWATSMPVRIILRLFVPRSGHSSCMGGVIDSGVVGGAVQQVLFADVMAIQEQVRPKCRTNTAANSKCIGSTKSRNVAACTTRLL
jgi:hypothetical protein